MTAKEIVDNFIRKNIKLVTERPDIAQSQSGTESESSKDYTGRVVFEFFQNAIDRAESNVWLELTENAFIISNDGEAFSIEAQSTDKYKKSDFHSLNTIHNSNKKAGESVGNKGVGFKSCWNVSNHVTIESIKDNEPWGFELFNPIEVKDFEDNDDIKLAIEAAGEKGVPSFYFPKYIDSAKDHFSDGKITKVTIHFHLGNSKAREEIETELDDFEKTKFFFLNQLKKKKEKKLTIHIRGNSITSQDSNWNIIDLKSKSEFESELKELIETRALENYANIPSEPNIAIAFPPENIEDIDAKFYTYLPTKAECGFNILIHADFALDNARVSIPGNDYNNKILEIAAKLFVSELLHNEELHTRKDFAKFLIPTHRDEKFTKLVWNHLIHENTLTEILKKVFKKESTFPRKSYELIFNVIETWVTLQKSKIEYEWFNYRKRIYDDILQYFCSNEIYIVPVADNYITYIPKYSKDSNEENDRSKKLFHIVKTETSMEFSLLKNLISIDISDFEGINETYFTDRINLVKKFSTVEIYRALSSEPKDNHANNMDILHFIYQGIKNNNITTENIEYFNKNYNQKKNDPKNYLAKFLLPTKNNGWQLSKKCFFNISKEVSEKFVDFYEVDFEKINDIFTDINELKYFGAWNTIPITENFELPWNKNNLPQVNKVEFKILLQDSIIIWKKIEEISKDEIKKLFLDIREQKLFFDEIHESQCSPNEVFLFNDERKRKGVNQEKKDDSLRELYEFFKIYSIEDTRDREKLLRQLNKLKNNTIDKTHKTLYKQLVLSLSKCDDYMDIESSIPLLSDNSYVDSGCDVWFADRNTKRYKHYFGDKINFVEFDIETSKKFIENVGVKDFNPDFTLMPNKAIREYQGELKQEIEKKFLTDMFCLAEERMQSRFDKEDAIARWNNLSIGYAEDVWIELTLNSYNIEIGKNEKNDVLFKPLSDSQRQGEQNKQKIGDFIHDLEGESISDVINNPKFSDFGDVIADGVFRDTLLGPTLSVYLKDTENFLLKKGIPQTDVDEMKIFIEQSLLSIEGKNEILQSLKKIGLDIDGFSEIRDFQKYEGLDITFKEFEQEIDSNYASFVLNIINEYKSHIKNKIAQDIFTNKQNLELICYMDEKKRDAYSIKYDDIINHKIGRFKVETDIFKLFGVDKNKIGTDEFIEAKIDYEYFTDDIKENELDLINMNNTLKGNASPSTGNAQQSNEKREKSRESEEKSQQRGLGQELKIAYKYAKEIKDKESFIDVIKEKIYVDDEKLKGNSNLNKYLENLDKYKNANNLNYAKNVLQIANNNLDGLGYDLIIPNETQDDIFKVELKSTTRSTNIEIHFSDNEIRRILHYKEVDNWKIWLNSKENDITDEVREAVKDMASKTKDILFSFSDYILKFNNKG